MMMAVIVLVSVHERMIPAEGMALAYCEPGS